MNNRLKTVFGIVAASLVVVGTAQAGDYPVTGTWTYDSASDQGPATGCGGPNTMTFGNGMRHDTVGSVPELKNKTATQTGAGQYQMVDTFYNGQTWGSVSYQMQVVDQDHVQINYGKGGSYTLRRCQ
jgi:hypothetical protein